MVADISDRETINKLCIALTKSTEEGEQFMKSLHSKWMVVIGLKSKQKILFGVHVENEVTGLEVSSNGDSGWHYSNLHADSFGKEIEKITTPYPRPPQAPLFSNTF